MLSCRFTSYLQAAEEQQGEELQEFRSDVSIAIPPPPPEDEETVEITPEMLLQFTQVPNNTDGLLVLRHRITQEKWVLDTEAKELFMIPDGMTETSWVKWPRLRKAAKWISKPEPASWLAAGFTILVAVPTFGWAQPWWGSDPDPKEAFQTYSGIASSGTILVGLLPLAVICADRHLNPRPDCKMRRYNMREGTLATSHIGDAIL